MEENLKKVDNNIVIIKSMALEIGGKISKQNPDIMEIENKVKLLLLNPEVIHWDNSAFVALEIYI